MAETRYQSKRYAAMGASLIESEAALAHLRDCDATICFLGSDCERRSRGRVVYGECERVADKNKWAMPCDFTITVFEPNCGGMDDEHIRRLLFHELLHVGIGHDRDGNERYYVVPHDIEDFRACVDRWGADWRASQPRETRRTGPLGALFAAAGASRQSRNAPHGAHGKAPHGATPGRPHGREEARDGRRHAGEPATGGAGRGAGAAGLRADGAAGFRADGLEGRGPQVGAEGQGQPRPHGRA